MRIMFVSKDIKLYEDLLEYQDKLLFPIKLYSKTNEPLDIMSSVCTQNPPLIVLDDDFTKPQSAHLLKSIRKVKESLFIIFLTSNESIDLGKEITSLAVQFYAIKPISGKDLMQSINSILKYKSTQTN